MADCCDAVVIGAGFAGAVAASDLGNAGHAARKAAAAPANSSY
jgi:monoamine oxidase